MRDDLLNWQPRPRPTRKILDERYVRLEPLSAAKHGKDANRDTAWFAMIDKDWPALSRAYTAWLDPENFDGEGEQRQRLKE